MKDNGNELRAILLWLADEIGEQIYKKFCVVRWILIILGSAGIGVLVTLIPKIIEKMM